MDPSSYIPRYLERAYVESHPDLSPAARELVREQVAHDPDRFAGDAHAQALLSYARAHGALMEELARIADVPDDEFTRRREEAFAMARDRLRAIADQDPWCVDAHLVLIQLSEIPLDACLGDMIELERRVREHLARTRPGFNPDAPTLWDAEAFEGAVDFELLTTGDPEIVGWLHALEALAQGCIFTARYRAAATYARLVMRAPGYPSCAVGTLLLALARLEDEDTLFEVAQELGEDIEGLPWFLLARAILLYKLGQRRSAQRALREFANRCDGGAFFLLNPTYHDPYLPVRPPARTTWELSHQAVWEADGILADTPGFATWVESIEGLRDIAEEFAARNGF
ncbi:MAG: hypothetical protein Q4B77_05705 [Coriobacteriaceae bacterium]|nr:hypothetical protein [Coriobacteriaceae bacterium]